MPETVIRDDSKGDSYRKSIQLVPSGVGYLCYQSDNTIRDDTSDSAGVVSVGRSDVQHAYRIEDL